ncbi:MAG: fgd2 1 [Frankiales bacterium]|nr:fgd2 1 [Frankiales bacterium]
MTGSSPIKIRVSCEPQQGATYDQIVRMAQAVDDSGFDAFFRSDHYLRIGKPSDQALIGTSDAWLTLGALARETKRVRLGTMLTPATFRHPGQLALMVAQVDQMSGGRAELGFGAGWYEAEHAAYGMPYPELPERFDRFAEQIEIIDGFWTTPLGENYNFSGEYYQIVDSPALPKPVQATRPAIIMGGQGKRRSAALAARFASEYNVAFKTVEDSQAVFSGIRAAVEAAGRAPESMTYSVEQTGCVGRTDADIQRRADAQLARAESLRKNAFGGTPAEIVDKIGRYTEIGVTTFYLQLMDFDDLDQIELIASDILPQVGANA